MKAYSLDLRERVITLIDAGLSAPAIAARLHVSVATVKRYRRRHRAGLDLAPRPRPGRPAVKATALDAALTSQLRAHPDATLAEHCRHWHAQADMSVSASTMRRAILRADWTVKKSPSSLGSATKSTA